MQTIRRLNNDPAEWQRFLRFLELCYGCGFDFFPQTYPQFYALNEENLRIFHVVEQDGEFASHVGLFPLRVVMPGVELMAGGIGGVCTHPEHRGRGHMTALLRHVVAEMDRRKWPLSVLWGDRTRYRHFGWEFAGESVALSFSTRSLQDAGIAPVPVREAPGREAVARAEELHRTPACYVSRPGTRPTFENKNFRVWLTKSGYACGQGSTHGVSLYEVFAEGEDVLGILLGVMKRTRADRCDLSLGAADARLGYLLRGASAVAWERAGSFRINDSVAVLRAAAPLLERRLAATGTAAFEHRLRIERVDAGELLEVCWDGKRVAVGAAESADATVAWDEWTRFVIGGPVTADTRDRCGPLGAALPLRVFIPGLDHV